MSDGDGIDPIGCLISGLLSIAVFAALLKFAIVAFRWALR